MKQQDLDGLIASGLKPIVIDENFDFNQLNGLFNEQVGQRVTQTDTDERQQRLDFSTPDDPPTPA